MAACANPNCTNSLAGLNREDTRRFCSSRCRKAAANDANQQRWLDWRADGRSLEWFSPGPDLIDLAPECAAFYVLTCRDQRGVRWSFPARGGFRLRPFELPQVPLKGRYEVTFLDFNGRKIIQATPRQVPIGRAAVGIALRQGRRNRWA